MNDFHLHQAMRALDRGGIIAYPTEAVFGLGCYPEDHDAVKKILLLKGRSISKGLILVAANVEQIDAYVSYPNHIIKQKVVDTWPGAVTWLLPVKANAPYCLTGYKTTIAVRVSSHPLVQGLCACVGPIISTSANPAGLPPARSNIQVRRYFGNSIDYILPGNTGGMRRPTEIRDAATLKVLRCGD